MLILLAFKNIKKKEKSKFKKKRKGKETLRD
jgi:hypothetical protein